MSWKDASKESPEEDGRYAVIYQQGGYVRRVFCDYSVEHGWLTGMADVQILAWQPFDGIPQWIIDKAMEEAA